MMGWHPTTNADLIVAVAAIETCVDQLRHGHGPIAAGLRFDRAKIATRVESLERVARFLRDVVEDRKAAGAP